MAKCDRGNQHVVGTDDHAFVRLYRTRAAVSAKKQLGLHNTAQGQLSGLMREQLSSDTRMGVIQKMNAGVGVK